MGVEIKGQEELKALMAKLDALASSIKGARLNPVKRSDTSFGNDEIIEELKKQNRDFAKIDTAEAERIAKAFAKKSEQLLAQNSNAKPNAVAADSIREAMAEYMRIVAEHIEGGNVVNGDLDPAYADQKQKRWGFTKPIGKASGQLLDNLNPSKSESMKNVRPIIKKGKR